MCPSRVLCVGGDGDGLGGGTGMRESRRISSANTSEDAIAAFKDECSWLLTTYDNNQRLSRALSGLYYSVKSTRLAPRIVHALLSGDPTETVDSGRGEDACFVAEAMLRSVHSSGDLLAQVLNICLCEPRLRTRDVSLNSVLKRIRVKVAECEEGTPDNDWYKAIASGLGGIGESAEYQYIADFTNTAKHRHYIERTLLTSEDGCRIVFGAFKKDSREHETRTFEDVLSSACSVVDECLDIVALVERRRAYDKVVAKGGTVVGDFYNVSATPMVMPLARYTPRRHLPD